MDPVLPAPNYPVALAGAFMALEALQRSRSIGKFHFGNPVYELMAKMENDAAVLINLILTEARKEGIEL